MNDLLFILYHFIDMYVITYISMLKRYILKKWKNYKFEKSEWGLWEAEFSIH